MYASLVVSMRRTSHTCVWRDATLYMCPWMPPNKMRYNSATIPSLLYRYTHLNENAACTLSLFTQIRCCFGANDVRFMVWTNHWRLAHLHWVHAHFIPFHCTKYFQTSYRDVCFPMHQQPLYDNELRHITVADRASTVKDASRLDSVVPAKVPNHFTTLHTTNHKREAIQLFLTRSENQFLDA
jgi:hypothetical protein